jgi:hypothetical protein
LGLLNYYIIPNEEELSEFRNVIDWFFYFISHHKHSNLLLLH